jgi:hypothetical protein
MRITLGIELGFQIVMFILDHTYPGGIDLGFILQLDQVRVVLVNYGNRIQKLFA